MVAAVGEGAEAGGPAEGGGRGGEEAAREVEERGGG